MTIRFCRIGTGWGLAGTFTELATAHDSGKVVRIRTRTGRVSRVVIEQGSIQGGPGDATCTALFHETNERGEIATRATTREPARSHHRRRQCPTGGNCSSFGDGRSCGADDCDGW